MDYIKGFEEKDLSNEKGGGNYDRDKDKDKIDFVKLNRDSEVIRYNSELANAGVRIKKKSNIIQNPTTHNISFKNLTLS